MQIAMLLNSECDIELLRFQLRFHSDVGIAKFLIWSDSNSEKDLTQALESRASAISGLLPDSSEVKYCKLPQSVTDENQRLVWLSEFCISEGYADWVVDNSGADFWLADGELTERLDELERSGMDSAVAGHTFEVQVMVNEPGAVKPGDPVQQGAELSVDLYAHLTGAIYQLPSDCYSSGDSLDQSDDERGAILRRICHNKSMIEAADSPDQILSKLVLPLAQSSTISVLHYPQLMTRVQHTRRREVPGGVPEISDHSVFAQPLVTDSANVRLNPCMRLYCSMNRFEDQQDAQSAA